MLMIITSVASSNAQMTGIFGAVRYEHQYQDALAGDRLSSLQRRNPQLLLGTSGYLYSPALLTFGLRTSLNAQYSTAQFDSYSQTSRQLLYNYYDVNIDALRNFIAQISVSARDAELENTSQNMSLGERFARTRQQQQRISVSSDKLDFLPRTNIGYTRTRSWSLSPDILFEQVQNDYAIDLAQSTPGSTLALSANLLNSEERHTGVKTNHIRLGMNASKQLTADQRVDVNGEYYEFESLRSLSGSGIYSNSLSEEVRLSSNVTAVNMSSLSSSSTTFNGSQSAQWLYSQNFHFGLGAYGQLGRSKVLDGSFISDFSMAGWGTSASAQHMRTILTLDMSNSVTGGYDRSENYGGQQTLSGSLSNSLRRMVGSFQLDANHGSSVSSTAGKAPFGIVAHSIGLGASGGLMWDLGSQSIIEYRYETRTAEGNPISRTKSARFQQRIDASTFFLIPVNLGATGSVNWSWVPVAGRWYAFDLTFTTPHFFVIGLSVSYRFSKTFDPLAARSSTQHSVDMTYQWRSLAFQARFQEFRYLDRRREFWFAVSRPF